MQQAEEQDFPRDLMHAGFYALLLRSQGYAPEEAAALVAQRYPRTRTRLRNYVNRANAVDKGEDGVLRR